MGTLDDLFTGKKVLVEVNLYSSGRGDSDRQNQTVLYEGVYQGLQELGPRQMYVLKDANYYTPSGEEWDDSEFEGEDSTSRIETDTCAIPVENVLSICLERSSPKR